MKILLLLLIITTSFSANSQVCRVDWTNATEFVSDEVMVRTDVASYELYLHGTDDPTRMIAIAGSSTRHIWLSPYERCTPCGTVFLRTIYTDGSYSPFSTNACGNTAPELHGFRAAN